MNWEAMGLMGLILLAAILFADIAIWLMSRGVPDRVVMAMLFVCAIVAVGVLA